MATYTMVDGGELSGRALMNKGIKVDMAGDFVSRVIHLKRTTA